MRILIIYYFIQTCLLATDFVSACPKITETRKSRSRSRSTSISYTARLRPYLTSQDCQAVKKQRYFSKAVVCVDPTSPSVERFVVRAVKLKEATAGLAFEPLKLSDGLQEGNFLACEADGDLLYIQKRVVHINDLCQDITGVHSTVQETDDKRAPVKIENGELAGDLAAVSDWFKGLDRLGAGAFGNVKALILEDGSKIAIKMGSLKDVPPSEISLLSLGSQSTWGTNFYGCFTQGGYVYVATKLLYSNLNDKKFNDMFVSWDKTTQAKFFVKLAEALESFGNTGFVHNDLAPKNIMIDESGHPFLIDFGLAVPLEAAERNSGSVVYASPNRRYSKVGDKTNDVYSMAASILAIISGKGEAVWGDDDLMADFDKSRYPDLPDEQNNKRFKRLIIKVVEPVWGEISMKKEDETEFDGLNLTSILYQVLVKLNPFLTQHEFTTQLRRIAQNSTDKIVLI